MFSVQKYRYISICEHYSIIVWKCKVGVGGEVGREGKGREGKTEEETKGGTEEKGRGYGREDFEVAHDLERCIGKWSGILTSISIIYR
ncbi:hypothetical protein [Hungatella sp.]|uniref:hypothetical protein n=1 Tax=Hungatella sp. TaxID=2613924 RepID=UPI002A8162B8|nr:hypothetical protein [Hungatella sp.]